MSQLAPNPTLLRQRQPVERSNAEREYMGWIAQLPCVICGAEPVEVAHVRMAAPEFGKRQCGKGEKPSDWWTLPLCPDHHRLGPDAQHSTGERAWWAARGIDPISVCLHLQGIHEDRDRAEIAAREYLARVR